jgi:hypothetical protein
MLFKYTHCILFILFAKKINLKRFANASHLERKEFCLDRTIVHPILFSILNKIEVMNLTLEIPHPNNVIFY